LAKREDYTHQLHVDAVVHMVDTLKLTVSQILIKTDFLQYIQNVKLKFPKYLSFCQLRYTYLYARDTIIKLNSCRYVKIQLWIEVLSSKPMLGPTFINYYLM